MSGPLFFVEGKFFELNDAGVIHKDGLNAVFVTSRKSVPQKFATR
jgi:hypothetical protein